MKMATPTQPMRKSSRNLLAAGAVIGVIALGLVGASTTGAYLSDTVPGNISGTIGTIEITSGNAGSLAYDRLLPGTPQTVTADYTNTGNSPQDVYVVFDNADALHSLNDLGTYGEFHVAANGVQKFDSANLNDNTGGTCGPLSPSGCWPVPRVIKLVDGLAPGASGNVSFTFGYASKMTSPEAAWNAYPLGAPTASGLPFTLVAVQQGQTP